MKTKSPFLILLICLFITACSGQQLLEPSAPEQFTQTENNQPEQQPVLEAAAPQMTASNETARVDTAQTTDVVPVAQTAADTAVFNTQTTNQANCPTEHFLDVTADPANSAYAAPQLSVTCTDSTLIVASNGIPSYEFVSMTPNGLQTQNYQWQVPLNPVAATEETAVPFVGAIGFTVNGMPIFAPNEAPRDNYGDAYLDGLLDYCNGHTAQQGTYHYHARPDCLFENIEGNPYLVIGYGLDGYPILAPYACTDTNCSHVVKLESSYQQTGDGYQRGDNTWEAHTYVENLSPLDECNGMTLTDGSYAYFATDTFPYFLGCYHGVVNGNTGGQNAPNQQPQGNQENNNLQPPQQDQANQSQGQGPDFANAAQQLGVTEQELRNALGQGRPNIQQAAATLGISEEALINALGIPSPGQGGPPPANG